MLVFNTSLPLDGDEELRDAFSVRRHLDRFVPVRLAVRITTRAPEQRGHVHVGQTDLT